MALLFPNKCTEYQKKMRSKLTIVSKCEDHKINKKLTFCEFHIDFLLNKEISGKATIT